MRKTVAFSLLLLALVFMFAAVPALAYEGPAPFTENGVFMVPLRWIAQANNAEVLPGADGQVVVFARKVEDPVIDEFGVVVKPGKTYERVAVFQEGEAKVTINGVEVPMPAPAEVREGRLFVPVQFALIAAHI